MEYLLSQTGVGNLSAIAEKFKTQLDTDRDEVEELPLPDHQVVDADDLTVADLSQEFVCPSSEASSNLSKASPQQEGCPSVSSVSFLCVF